MATARKSLTSKKVSWEARYYIRKPDGGLIYKIKKGFSTKSEAQAYGVAHEHESSVSSNITMLEMFDNQTMLIRQLPIRAETVLLSMLI